MKPKVYLETSIISYLTAFPSNDVITAGHQLTTFDWWENHRRKFEIVASELVVQEASLGNAQMANKRLAVLKDVEILIVDNEARNLAKILVAEKAVPEKAAADTLHIAVATVEEIERTARSPNVKPLGRTGLYALTTSSDMLKGSVTDEILRKCGFGLAVREKAVSSIRS